MKQSVSQIIVGIIALGLLLGPQTLSASDRVGWIASGRGPTAAATEDDALLQASQVSNIAKASRVQEADVRKALNDLGYTGYVFGKAGKEIEDMNRYLVLFTRLDKNLMVGYMKIAVDMKKLLSDIFSQPNISYDDLSAILEEAIVNAKAVYDRSIALTGPQSLKLENVLPTDPDFENGFKTIYKGFIEDKINKFNFSDSQKSSIEDAFQILASYTVFRLKGQLFTLDVETQIDNKEVSFKIVPFNDLVYPVAVSKLVVNLVTSYEAIRTKAKEIISSSTRNFQNSDLFRKVDKILTSDPKGADIERVESDERK